MERLKEFSPGPVKEDTVRLIESIRKYGNGGVIITPKGEAMFGEEIAMDGTIYVGIVNIDPFGHNIPQG